MSWQISLYPKAAFYLWQELFFTQTDIIVLPDLLKIKLI